ncbi:uncharacterized protein LOC142471888 [Ascaphus truei]|uniref:uncharacterized protein LOC142471888 n=1 Tax=Ascaphus truei TaxID=8439 RepID=UPI003F592367
MQPRLPQTQVFPNYPIFGNVPVMPLGVPNTQMFPIMFTQLGQQALQSSSEESVGPQIFTGVIMLPINHGLQGHVITAHQAGVGVAGGILVEQQGLNPVGQQGVNTAFLNNETRSIPDVYSPDITGIASPEGGRNAAPGSSIRKGSIVGSFPTYTPPVGYRKTPTDAEHTVPAEEASQGVTETPETTETDNWIFCHSYMPDNQDLHDLIRGDGHITVIAPKDFVIEKTQDQNQK